MRIVAYGNSWFELVSLRFLDRGFLFSLAALLSVGLIMVASSSLDFAGEHYGDPWFFVKKQGIFLLLGLVGCAMMTIVPMSVWSRYSGALLLLAVALLVAVLVPGIGKEVNGSRRWLSMGPVTIQASEVAKFCLILFFASYLARRNEDVRKTWSAFFKMVFVIAVFVALLLLEPDFGSSVVLCITLGAMMFVAGVPMFRFLMLTSFGVMGLAAMAIYSPYRWERLVAFMDPWSRQFDTGYQLVQSLIAFGRGEWLGLGLGNSLQKLFFLPESHTDFIFSIIAEEFGLLGVIVLIILFAYFIAKILLLAKQAGLKGQYFNSYVVFGIAILLAVQSFINMGVAAGLLPTKGLTLPFISYGGSSLLITFGLVALVVRSYWELSHDE